MKGFWQSLAWVLAWVLATGLTIFSSCIQHCIKPVSTHQLYTTAQLYVDAAGHNTNIYVKQIHSLDQNSSFKIFLVNLEGREIWPTD